MNLDTITGFKDLRFVAFLFTSRRKEAQNSSRPEDQSKIRMAIALRRVDPADIPASAKAAPNTTGAPPTPVSSQGPSQKKRKAAFEAAQAAVVSTPARTPAPQALRHLIPTATQIAEDETVEDVAQEESIDELIVSMKASIVGVQYYKGKHILLRSLVP